MLPTQQLITEICDLVASGSNINVIARKKKLSGNTVREWLRENKEYASLYTRAREARADARADRIDTYKRKMLHGFLTTEQCRIAIECEKWQAGKENPKRYGDKSHIEHTGTLTLSQLVEQSYTVVDVTPANSLLESPKDQ